MTTSYMDKMEDLEARREARRRRILQSSEDRMNRVMGRQIDTTSGDATFQEATETDISETSTKLSPNAEDMGGIRLRNPISSSTELSNESKLKDENMPRSTVKISPLKKTHLSTDSNSAKVNAKDSISTSRSSSEAKMMLKHFEFLRIVLCFIVAFLCRRVLATGYGIFYVQTILLPFGCMETGFFLFKHKVLHNVILPHRSSMLVGLLMLCGLKPSIVQLYNKTMGYLTAASEDFALFFFAFMMAHLFLV